ncbi:MAG: molybdopterin oxidoreductase [Candidatus Hecatellales archaeon]|nr:MAG: molybdopterin oxidoreductase [Candidatus Hecatellales archaeon]
MVDTKIVQTVCGMCSEGCGMKVYLENGKVVKVEGVAENPKSLGVLCPKGYASIDYLYSPDRLKYPMVKKNGEWVRVSWDEALNLTVSKLKEIREKHGAKGLAVYFGEGLGHADIHHIIYRFCDLYGTPNVFSSASLCFRSRVLGILLTLGKLPEPDIQNSRCIIVWAFNPSNSSLPTAKRILEAKKKGAKLIVVDCKRIELAKSADLHVQLRPGTDCALALGMINVIIDEKLYDEEFVEKWVFGFEELKQHIKKYSPEEVEKITWVPAETIRKMARIFATNKPSCIVSGNALNLQVSAVQANRAHAILQALTGNIDVEGGWITISRLRVNPMRVKKGETEKPLGAKEYPVFYGFWDRIYGEGHAMILPDVLLTGKPYPIKAMIVCGGNPAVTWPNTKKVLEALKKLEFLVVIDIFMSETAKLADVILPACTFLEKSGIFDYGLSGIPYVAFKRKVLEPLYESWSDWKIWFELGRRMGYKEYFPWENEEEALEEMLKPSGLTLDRLKENPAGLFYGSKKPKNYEGRGFKTPTKKIEFYSETLKSLGYEPLPTHAEPRESPLTNPNLANDYPLVLTTGARSLYYTHSRYRNLKVLRSKEPEPTVEIHPKTAEKFGVFDGETVKVKTLRGSIRVKTKITEDILPGVVSIPHGWVEANVNLLTDDGDRDPISGYPTLKACLCRIEKVKE